MTNNMKLTSLMNSLEKLSAQNANDDDIFSNVAYICQSSNLICDSLKNGKDVAQLENGDIVISERKIFTYKYSWDDKKCKFVRAKDESRLKRYKNFTYEEDTLEEEYEDV